MEPCIEPLQFFSRINEDRVNGGMTVLLHSEAKNNIGYGTFNEKNLTYILVLKENSWICYNNKKSNRYKSCQSNMIYHKSQTPGQTQYIFHFCQTFHINAQI